MAKRKSPANVTAWPADKVERRPIDALVPYARNARTHSEAQVDQIAASIREWGWTSPVLITEENTIIAGHGRVRAARKLGLSDVPVMVATGWSKAQIQAYALADNKLALNAGWDEALLALEIEELQGAGFEIELIGFDDAEIASICAPVVTGLTDPDEVPEPPANPVARAGDLWILGRHRLLCGDSTRAADVKKVLGGVQPHLMVTDPPYGVEYDPGWRATAGVKQNKEKLGKVANDNRADWREAWALFPGSVAYVWHAGRYASTVQDSLSAVGFDVRSQIIWAKDRFALSRGHYHWQHEPCWYAVRNGPASWTGDRKQSTLWQIPAREGPGFEHGTQKPVECMKRPIENNSSPGHAIYEPFSGSGTTIIAAEMTGRSCHAIELMGQYVDVAIERWQSFTGETARLDDGRSFPEVSAERLGEEKKS
ncbi:site-specific DNA-methyltransferase [Pseudorhodoplanes sp.]|uniref:site-specific DNA-methyltransferase n=1 Tax=Pseudorhodoplanes sp. TaxID=1934341 RepID=UPI003D10A6FE